MIIINMSLPNLTAHTNKIPRNAGLLKARRVIIKGDQLRPPFIIHTTVD
jgi:hypothetical protein